MQPEIYHQAIHKLQTIYTPHGVNLYTRGDNIYPFTMNYTDLDIPLDGTLATELPQTSVSREELPFYDETLVASLQAQGKRLYDGVTFRFEHINQDSLQVHAQLGSYFDHLTTCMMLEDELVGQNTFPYRDKLHEIVPPAELMVNGQGRSVALGVGTLIVFRHQDGSYKLIVTQRSADTAHKGGALHVAPAFIFQPSSKKYPPQEWGLTYQIQREYVEELFDVEEMETGNANFAQSAPAQAFAKMLRDGRATIHLTGMVLNLLTTQVAFCTLIVIHNEKWFEQIHGNGGWEMSNLYTASIATDEQLLASLPTNAFMNFTPIGAAAMWLGVDRARRILKL